MTAPPITGRTRLLGLVADPIAQALTPSLVNPVLAARGREAVLVPLHVGADGLAALVVTLRSLRNFVGAVVSMPHKIAVVPLLDEVTAEVRQVGACNVVRREDDGRLVGTMYDGEGFVAGLRRAGHDPAGARVLLAGAGGAARAMAHALARHGVAALTIQNRTRVTAEALAASVRAACPAVAIGTESPPGARFDLVVNGTALGMAAGDPLPVDPALLGSETVAADVVVKPEVTPFLAEAERRGARIHTGPRMLEAQLELMLDFMRI